MQDKVSRIAVDGLRSSDPTVLSVMIQDIINKPIDKLSQRTLCDLIALSETEGLPRSLERELSRFRDKMAREYNDIPVGTNLSEHLGRLAELPAEQIPASWREAVLARIHAGDIDERSRGLLAELAGRFERTPPEAITVASAPTVHVQRSRGPERPRSGTSLSRNTATPARGSRSRSGGSRSGASRSGASRPARDPQRTEWIREDVLNRLSGYGSKGLKQAILVAGAKHRAPWEDLSDEEIVSVLRALLREDRVRFSAGRWSIRGRGW